MPDASPVSHQPSRASRALHDVSALIRRLRDGGGRFLYFASVALRFLREEPNKREAIRLAIVTVVLFLAGDRTQIGRPMVVRPSTPDGKSVEIWLWNFIDVLVVREIFLDAEYRIPDPISPSTILDLGANIGVSALYFRAVYPDAVVLAVEPDPVQFQRLERNTAGDPKIRTLEAAATVRSGPVTFYQATQGWVSALERPERIPATETTVTGLSIPEILARGDVERVDLIKLDIEGGEWPLLEAGAIQSATDLVVGELHRGSPERARQLLDGWSFTTHQANDEAATFTASR